MKVSSKDKLVVVVQTGLSNTSSVAFALDRLGCNYIVSSSKAEIEKASHVILPGVGSASAGMKALQKVELIETLQNLKMPVLGICLGMQLLFSFSEEGEVKCLGVIPGKVKLMKPSQKIRIPHMGWNEVTLLDAKQFGQTESKANLLSLKIQQDLSAGMSPFAYFVHSFAAEENEFTYGRCNHGADVPSLVGKDNFIGVQFHPEKSSEFGSKIIERFLEL